MSRLSFTALASKASPFWNVTFGRRLISQRSKAASAIHDVASQGSAPPLAFSLARGSSTDDATRLPAAAHSAMAGFHESDSAGTAMTMLPPFLATSFAGSRPPPGTCEVAVLVWWLVEDPQAEASRASASAHAMTMRAAPGTCTVPAELVVRPYRPEPSSVVGAPEWARPPSVDHVHPPSECPRVLQNYRCLGG